MRYEIDGELGRGGMAVVHAGADAGLGRRVALKVLAAHLAGDAAFRERFLREARIAGRLQHPNLVRVYDITELDGLPCIVMELVDGGTLERGQLTLEDAAQLADAIAYAHAHGVVHRDLKPSNLLRTGDGTVKIADFGIARALAETSVTEVGTVLGTLRYLAPEQAAGQEVGPPADVYALAVVFSELVVEQPPHVRRLLERCRDPEPARRPSAADVAASLRSAATPAVERYGRRRRAPLAAAAAALLAALAVALALVLTRGSSPSPAPTPIAPVARSSDAAQQARDLSSWLRRYSG